MKVLFVFEGFLVVVKVEFVGVKIFVFCPVKITGKGVVVVDSLMVVVGAVLMCFVCLQVVVGGDKVKSRDEVSCVVLSIMFATLVGGDFNVVLCFVGVVREFVETVCVLAESLNFRTVKVVALKLKRSK